MKEIILYKTKTPKWVNQLMVHDTDHPGMVSYIDPNSKTRKTCHTGYAPECDRIPLIGIEI